MRRVARMDTKLSGRPANTFVHHGTIEPCSVVLPVDGGAFVFKNLQGARAQNLDTNHLQNFERLSMDQLQTLFGDYLEGFVTISQLAPRRLMNRMDPSALLS